MVVPVAVSQEDCQELYYLVRLKEKLISSRCGIFVFTKALLGSSNISCLQVIFYGYGLLESRGINVFPYIVDLYAQQLEYLFMGKPLSYIQGATEFGKIFEELKALRLPKESYLNDPALNKLVLSRIKYVKITAIIEISWNLLLQFWQDKENSWGENKQDFNIKAIANNYFCPGVVIDD